MEEHSVTTTAFPFPRSIVWAPLPIISWLLPLVGHVGITDSRGNIYDFAGSFRINNNQMLCGPPARYLQLPLFDGWDIAVERANNDFSRKVHCLVKENCHSHVIAVINQAAPESKMSLWKLYWMLALKGHPIGRFARLRTYGGFIIISLCIIVFFGV